MEFVKRKIKSAGFTLIEVMLVISVISVLAGIGYFALTNIRESSQNTKLNRDVATVNNALRVYAASGGSVAGITDPQLVLNKMKAQLKGDSALQMAGMKGALVDKRLAVIIQTPLEASSGDQRAYWDPATLQFTVKSSGDVGIKEFTMNESLASVDYGTDARQSAFKLAKANPWVWDHNAASAPTNPGPGTIPTTDGEADPGTPGGLPAALKLQGPKYSVPSGSYEIMKYPMDLTLTNPNPTGTSNILYSVNGSEWKVFHDPIKLNPSDRVDAMIGSLDPEKWTDSDKGRETYTSTPISPEFELVFDKSAYNYIELGGTVIPGANAPGKSSVTGELKLKNGSSIPTAYQSSDYFGTRWTMDGTDPLTSSAARKGDDFTGGFTSQKIPVSVADYAKATSLTVKAGASAVQTSIFNNSSVVQKTLDINKLTLRPPLITVAEKTVTLALDTQYSDIPVGSRIFYTTDGSDPGVSNGLPVSGKEYTAPFDLDGTMGSTMKITARVYPPVTLVNWFNPSTTATKDVTLPGATDFYVGGNFYLSQSGSAGMRNIAKLTGAGTVDSGFDVGKGATENSLVGVIRQDAAGKVMAGGDFTAINNVTRPAVVRLNANGSVDSAFDAALAGGK